MAGLVFAVKFFGPRPWSLALGAAVFRLVAALVSAFLLGYWPRSILWSIVFGILWGVLVYAGLVLHLRKRGFRLSGGCIVP